MALFGHHLDAELVWHRNWRGCLFLPIKAGAGGLIPLLVILCLAFPLTFFAHRGLCRFVLAGKKGNITDVVEDDFGKRAGFLMTAIYFFAIYPILFVYGIGITNTVSSFIQEQMGIAPPSRWILSFLLIGVLMLVVHSSEKLVVKVMSILVYPFVIVLILISFALIPKWNADLFTQSVFERGFESVSMSHLFMVIWLVIPLMIFSFNHAAIISSFAVDRRQEYRDYALEIIEKKCSLILKCSNIMMIVVAMFFVFSCALCLSAADLQQADEQNVSILTYLANHFSSDDSWLFQSFSIAAPIVAAVAISKSFFGHYLGAKEGFVGLIVKITEEKKYNAKKLTHFAALFMFLTTWIVAALNPSILDLIDAVSSPLFTIILFFMPMYAIHTLPALQKYRGKASNVFVVVLGLLGICASFYEMFF